MDTNWHINTTKFTSRVSLRRTRGTMIPSHTRFDVVRLGYTTTTLKKRIESTKGPTIEARKTYATTSSRLRPAKGFRIARVCIIHDTVSVPAFHYQILMPLTSIATPKTPKEMARLIPITLLINTADLRKALEDV